MFYFNILFNQIQYWLIEICSRPKSLWKIGTPRGPISFSRGFFWQTLTPWLPPTMSRLFWTPSKLAKLFFLNIYFWLDYALCIFFIAHMYVIYLSYPIQGEKEEVLRRGRPSVWAKGFIGLRESILPGGPAKRPGLMFFIFFFVFCDCVCNSLKWNTNSRHPRLAATGTLQNTPKKRLTTCSSCQTVTSTWQSQSMMG